MSYAPGPTTPADPGFGWLIHLLWVIVVIAILVWLLKHFLF